MQRIITSTTFLTLLLIFGLSSVSFADIVISGDELWDTNELINDNVEILDGATLEITAKIGMDPYRYFKVRKGGTLIVNGGTITSRGVGPNRAWEGIYVEGDSNAPQEIGANTGFVYVLNSSVISNSRGGIRTRRQEQSGVNTGGVVVCDNSKFINNGRSIEFLQYNNGTTSSGVSNCRFIINQHFPLFNIGFIGHITAWQNQGLVINGNHFRLFPTLVNNQIFHNKVGVTFLHSSGSIRHNNFSNIPVGLEVNQEGAPIGYDYITVSHNKFNRHETGARLISANMTITDNSFLVGSNAGGAVGLHILRSTDFTCKDNDFLGVDTNDGNYGMQVTNLNATSLVNTTAVRNRFSNLNRGINCVGINRALLGIRGFMATCSEFTGNKHSIFIMSDPDDPTPKDGIREIMSPDPSKCPSNIFTESGSFDVFNTTSNAHQYIGSLNPSACTPTVSGVILSEIGIIPWECEDGNVAMFNNGSTPESIDVNVVSKQQLKEVRLFPNPVTTELTVVLPTQENGQMANVSQVQIMSFTGQKVAPPVRKTGNGYQVDTQALPAGMYQIIVLMEDGERLVKPFIKAGR